MSHLRSVAQLVDITLVADNAPHIRRTPQPASWAALGQRSYGLLEYSLSFFVKFTKRLIRLIDEGCDRLDHDERLVWNGKTPRRRGPVPVTNEN